MEWGSTWHILQRVFALGAVVFTVACIIVMWRLRGIIGWKRSLRSELKELSRSVEAAGGTRKQALGVVLERCQRTWRATSPELGELTNLTAYIRSIAVCYHPGAAHPELNITIGRFLRSARAFVNRFEMILGRPGFKRFKRVRIRHIRQSYRLFDRINRYRVVQWLIRYQKAIKRLFHLRLYILPDPFSWIAYLSNRLTILILTKCLLVDVYLFIGKMAVQAYDEEAEMEIFSTEIDGLEQTLEALSTLESSAPEPVDPQIQAIRNRLVGVSSMIIASPGLEDWKKAVMETATVIAERYFPEAAHPLEEAALGPLLTRSQAWVQSICETEKISLVEKFYRVKIESLYSVKSFTSDMLSDQLKMYAKKTWEIYRWAKWPVKVYRRVKNLSPVGMAMDVGWVVAKKSFVNFICRQTFDLAHKELETIYNQSRFLKETELLTPPERESKLLEIDHRI
jgi:hypothetical protein